MLDSKLTRYMCAIIIGVTSVFKCLWIFVKMVVMTYLLSKEERWALDIYEIVETAKMGKELYIAQMRAIFEWANDGDMENCRKNMVKYMEEVSP